MKKFIISHHKVTIKDLDQFEKVILQALSLQSPTPVIPNSEVNINTLAKPDYFFDDQSSLVISFDKFWNPFLCNTKGLNRSEQRWYIPNKSTMIDAVSDALNDSKIIDFSQEGGRVFLNGDGANRRLPDGTRIEILNWELPRESPFLYIPKIVYL